VHVQDNAETNPASTIAAAPPAGAEPGPSVAAGGAQRWRRPLAIAAALAVVASLVVVATLVVVAVGPSGRRSSEPPPSAAPFDVTGARPVEEVWPEAVVRLPRSLPDGRELTPKGRLDNDRFVVVPRRGDAEDVAVVFNARTGQVTDLITAPVDWRADSASVSVSDRDIVLAVEPRLPAGTHRGPKEIWVAPRSGGPATRRTVLEFGTVVSTFGVGDTIFAVVQSLESDTVTTVYKLPVGGPPERVARADGALTRQYGRWFMTGPPGSGAPDTAPFTFLDVVTGERRTATRLDGLSGIVCSPDVCAGFEGTDLVVYRFDGSNPVRISGLTPEALTLIPVITRTGRFIGIENGTGGYIWDRQNNMAAKGWISDLGPLQPLRTTDDGMYLIDLSRIP
jgi:hypothetical protein